MTNEDCEKCPVKCEPEDGPPLVDWITQYVIDHPVEVLKWARKVRE